MTTTRIHRGKKTTSARGYPRGHKTDARTRERQQSGQFQQGHKGSIKHVAPQVFFVGVGRVSEATVWLQPVR